MSNQETGKGPRNQPKPAELLQELVERVKNGSLPANLLRQDDENRLRRLKRQELLQILVEQSKEIDRLRKELKETRKRLAARELKIDASGTLAEASLQIYDVLDRTQKAADLYLENIRLRAGVQDADDSEAETDESLEPASQIQDSESSPLYAEQVPAEENAASYDEQKAENSSAHVAGETETGTGEEGNHGTE